ncbi:MAG: T9SS type A sorting domain-containing protein [Janthinobacterium lividum]
MKSLFKYNLFAASLLIGGTPITSLAQTLADPNQQAILVTSACPGSNNTPSVLRSIGANGVRTDITKPVTLASDGTPLVINGLAINSATPSYVYGMNGTASQAAATSSIGPALYKISLNDGIAIPLGNMTPPDPIALQDGNTIGLTLSFIADADPSGNYYAGGLTFRLGAGFNPATGGFYPVLSNPNFYVGTLNLNAFTPPSWKLVALDANSAAVFANFTAATNMFLKNGGSQPSGGIQDWVYMPASGSQPARLVSYLGVEQKYMAINNPLTAPSAVTNPTPSPQIPDGTEVGSMWGDQNGGVYANVSGTGNVYKIDPTDGHVLATQPATSLGCTVGDAASGYLIKPLPVTLTAFTAVAATTGVNLAWTTASEVNADKFVVQRQTSAAAAWVSIGTVPATHPVGGSYTLRDAAPQAGLNYYRLLSVDLDGSSTYSPVRTVQLATTSAATLTVYPNPGKDAFTLALSAPAPDSSSAELRDMLGRVQWRADLSQHREISVRVPGLAAGVYLLSANVGGQISTQRLVVTQ